MSTNQQVKRDVNWIGEALASIVVFLVALPLCMGIAIASGLPPATGLITGIVGGLVVGTISGAPLQVSGPAAGLAVIVWELNQRYGVAVLGAIILLAGAIQLGAGFLRLGQWFRAVSPAVIQGMLAGIGVLIFASQFHVMVDDAPRGSGIANLAGIPEAVYKGLFPLEGTSHHLAAWLGVLTIVTMILWNAFRPKALKSLPAPLLGAAIGTLVAGVFRLDVKYVNIPDNLLATVSLLRPEAALDGGAISWGVLGSALALALIASAETLLCATAVDLMHDGPKTDYDRELKAQGLGNMICGMLGALPMTGVIVRSSANVQSGAKTRWSAVMHGLWLLLFVAAAPFVLRAIPTASLATILVYTGYKLVNISTIRELWRFSRAEVAIYTATVTAIVATDLLTGVLVGIGLALVRVLYALSHFDAYVEVDESTGAKRLHLEGIATFYQIPRLAKVLESLDPKEQVELCTDRLLYIDHGCVSLLTNWAANPGGLIIRPKHFARRRSRIRAVTKDGEKHSALTVARAE